jgi:UDP-2,3-diacylglucosamine hydrolase
LQAQSEESRCLQDQNLPEMRRIIRSISAIFGIRRRSALLDASSVETFTSLDYSLPPGVTVGMIAGNGSFPFTFAKEAKARGHRVIAVCHTGETDTSIEEYVDVVQWIRVGELGKLINTFCDHSVRYVAMAGGISRVRHFGDVKLDLRGSALLMRLRSTKDDVIMRGIADELNSEGIEVIPCTVFLSSLITQKGFLTRRIPSEDEERDISVGIDAIVAMSMQDIGQLVVVREGVIVAVEASEGSNEAILRGGALGGKGSVVIKCAKTTQDMRFDVPTAGLKTIEVMKSAGASVLALESGRSIIIDKDAVIAKADEYKISIVGIPPLVGEVLA